MLCHSSRSAAPIARHSADAACMTRARAGGLPSPPPRVAASRRAWTNAIQGVRGGRGASEPRVGRRRAARRGAAVVGGGVAVCGLRKCGTACGGGRSGARLVRGATVGAGVAKKKRRGRGPAPTFGLVPIGAPACSLPLSPNPPPRQPTAKFQPHARLHQLVVPEPVAGANLLFAVAPIESSGPPSPLLLSPSRATGSLSPRTATPAPSELPR